MGNLIGCITMHGIRQLSTVRFPPAQAAWAQHISAVEYERIALVECHELSEKTSDKSIAAEFKFLKEIACYQDAPVLVKRGKNSFLFAMGQDGQWRYQPIAIVLEDSNYTDLRDIIGQVDGAEAEVDGAEAEVDFDFDNICTLASESEDNIRRAVIEQINKLNGTQLTCAPARSLQILSADEQGLPKREAITDANPKPQLTAYINQSQHVLILPLCASDSNFFKTLSEKEGVETYEARIKALEELLGEQELAKYHIIAPVIGQGFREEHIVTTYRPPASYAVEAVDVEDVGNASVPVYVIDSKNNPWHSFQLPASISQTLIKQGSQSIWDGKTCGYHVMQNIDTLYSYIVAGRRLQGFPLVSTGQGSYELASSEEEKKSQEQNCEVAHGYIQVANQSKLITVVEPVMTDNNVLIQVSNTAPTQRQPHESSEREREFIMSMAHDLSSFLDKSPVELTRKYLPKAIALDTRWISYLRQAWQSTFPRDEYSSSFSQYFMGWPRGQGPLAWIAYMLGGFLLIPLKNTVKVCSEFLVKAMANTVDYLMDQLHDNLNRNTTLKQNLGGIALGFLVFARALLSGAWLLVRTITSPITSFKQAWHKHKALGILSAIFSIVGIAALCVFVPPLGFALLGKVGLSGTVAVSAAEPVIYGSVMGGVAAASIAVAVEEEVMSRRQPAGGRGNAMNRDWEDDGDNIFNEDDTNLDLDRGAGGADALHSQSSSANSPSPKTWSRAPAGDTAAALLATRCKRGGVGGTNGTRAVDLKIDTKPVANSAGSSADSTPHSSSPK